jgi:hypothetical protein
LPDTEIPKRHDLSFLHRSPFCRAKFVITVRDPLDMVASMLRIADLEPTPDHVAAKITEVQRQGINDAIALKDRPRVLVLRYEDFYHNFDNLFGALEAFLKVAANPERRANFDRDFSVAAVRRRSEGLASFDQVDANDGIHGRHVSETGGAPGAHRELLGPEQATRVREAFRDFTEAFGY